MFMSIYNSWKLKTYGILVTSYIDENSSDVYISVRGQAIKYYIN